ncbi:MAG: calcium:proton exchanger [Brotaphodocola sp.]
MPRNQRKISYIKKPFARKSFASLGFLAVALVSFAMSIGLSVQNQGNGEVNVAAWGLTSMIFAVTAIVYGVGSFLEKEMNYILSKISLVISSLLLILWIGMMIAGLFA